MPEGSVSITEQRSSAKKTKKNILILVYVNNSK